MTDIDTAHLRALAEKATPGPWSYTPTILGLPNNTVMAGNEQVGYTAQGHYRESDAAYIAATDPQTVLALLDEIDVLNDQIEVMGGMVK